ncbi:MAG: zonular occludens toxin domain-containing protein [Candidatus Methanomethylophilaceae archaeon]
MTYSLNRPKFLDFCFKRGTMMITDGHMGDGKTHQAVALSQEFIESYTEEPVYIITNIPFAHRTVSGYEKKYPENVFGICTMEDVYRTLCELLEQHSWDEMRVILILDEAQNFMSSDSHFSEMTKKMHVFLANIRKFGMAVWLLTPVIRNLGPRIRGGKMDGKDEGYCSIYWKKDMNAIRSFLDRNELDPKEAKRFTTVKWNSDMRPHIVYVPAPSWTTSLKDLPIGGYAYDTGAVAAFGMRNKDSNFDFDAVIAACGTAVSTNKAKALKEYFDDLDNEADGLTAEDAVFVRNREQCTRMDRYRELAGITWDQIAIGEDEPESTLRYRYNNYFKNNPSLKITVASKSAKREGFSPTRARREGERERIVDGGSKGFSPFEFAETAAAKLNEKGGIVNEN